MACVDIINDHVTGVEAIAPVYELVSADAGATLNIIFESSTLHAISIPSGYIIETAISTPTADLGLVMVIDDPGYTTRSTIRYEDGTLGAVMAMSQDYDDYITQVGANCLLSDDGTTLILRNQNYE